MWKGQREILALLLKTQSNNIVAGNQGSKGLKHNYSVKGSVWFIWLRGLRKGIKLP